MQAEEWEISLYEKFWSENLNKEEQKEFHSPHPDTLTSEIQNLSDLDKFNTPAKTQISENYALLMFHPHEGMDKYVYILVKLNTRNKSFFSR